MACLNMLKILLTSTPLSSIGNGSRPGMFILKSCLSISRSVIFINVSSSLLRIINPLSADFLIISTGNSNNGENLGCSLTDVSYHFKSPKHKYKVFAPFSSIDNFDDL